MQINGGIMKKVILSFILSIVAASSIATTNALADGNGIDCYYSEECSNWAQRGGQEDTAEAADGGGNAGPAPGVGPAPGEGPGPGSGSSE